MILLDLGLELGWRRDGCAVELVLAEAVHGGAELARFRASLRPFVMDARCRVGLGATTLEHALDLRVVCARRVVPPPLEVLVRDGLRMEAGEEGGYQRGTGALRHGAEDGVRVRRLVK